MKTIILVLCFIVTNAFCQSPLTEWALKFYNEIPPFNRKIIQEVDKLIDKKAGKGICNELIFEVLNNSVLNNGGLKVPLKAAKKRKQVWANTYWREITDSAIIYPGDIILYNKHVAIIYAKLSPTEYTVIHQNFSSKRKYSHVGFGTVNFEEVYLPEIYRITL